MSKKKLRQTIADTLKVLNCEYPDAQCSLNFSTPFELLVATIMSAQSTDIRVNKVTQKLFADYRSIEDYASAEPEDVAKVIRTVGCFRNKARSIVESARIICASENKQVPQTIAGLLLLPGVGRKTANVVLSNVFDQPGFAVDTHVKRVAYRLGWTTFSQPDKIETQLCDLISAQQWGHTSHLLIYHGRAVCKARKPQCKLCPIEKECAKCF
ncbi:MAG: endonuclease III [Thermodesulfobacteriota bacterium]|nr:endonuclease III [Thermodesulfobacteriota bacterium]